MNTGDILRRFRALTGYLPQKLRLKSIQVIIAGSFALLTVTCMLTVGLVLYSRFLRAAETNAMINAQQIIDQIKINLDNYIGEMLDISDYVNFEIYMQEVFCSEEFSEFLGNIMKFREDIVSLAVFSEKGELAAVYPSSGYSGKEVVTQRRWFRLAVESPERLFFSSPHVRETMRGQDRRIVSLSRSTNFYRMEQGIGGVLLVDMNFNAIDEMFKRVSLGKKGYVMILDSFGHIIFRPRHKPMLDMFDLNNIFNGRDRSFTKDINGDRVIITINTVEHAEWRIVGISYIDDLIATRKEIGNFMLWMLLLSVFFSMVGAIFISLKISHPIKILENSMKRVSEGNFDIISEVKGDNEVESLSRTFNMMLATIRDLMAQIVRDQSMIRKSELNALQAQIQPHFLYNTLDSILWMAEKGKSGEVVSMVTALSRFFRLSLSNGKSVISVLEELDQVRNYLIIQENRYKNKFTYKIEAQSDTLKCKIPKLLLQPVVENAIYHGIEGMVDKGEICISSSIVEGKLLLQVKDNGLGMSAEKLESLVNYVFKSKGTTSIGLKNVSERIKIQFGEEYGLELESELEKGTIVKLWLPVIYEYLKLSDISTEIH